MLSLRSGQFRWPSKGYATETGLRPLDKDWHLGAQGSRVLGARTIREDSLSSSNGRSGNLAAGRSAVQKLYTPERSRTFVDMEQHMSN